MKIYLVGGAIRNKLLKLPVIDKDWVVVGSTPEFLLKKKYRQVGKDFPVFLHPQTYEEYALARKERKSGKGYNGFQIDFGSNITLREDLIRRDLTINAIAQDCYGKYIDPFNGLNDIKLRVLRHISSAFSEDPLRVLRVARFSASFFHLGFIIAKKTMKLMSDIVKSKELLYLDVQRIWKETEKAMQTNHPHIFFQVLNCCNALSILFPEIIKLVLIHKNLYLLHATENIYERCFKSLANISRLSKEIDIKVAYLCQSLSFRNFNFYANKSEVSFNKLFIAIMLNFFSRLKVPIIVSNLSIVIIKNQYFLYNIYYQSAESVVHFFYQINAWRNPVVIDKLSFLVDTYIDNIKISLHKNKIFSPGQYLKKMFLIAQKVTFKEIEHKGMVGRAIALEFKRLRILSIHSWRSRFYEKI